MAHLNNRLCLVPFCDLADCPDVSHHAIGSPYFDAQGKPNSADPVLIAVRSDIVDDALPRATALAVSCNTRPYQSYGPVIRRVFECSQPNRHPELRRQMEGIMNTGEVRVLPPGDLERQISTIYLACVATMTTGTTENILQHVMTNLVSHFQTMPPGATLRMPLFGTGKSRTEAATEKTYQDVIGLTLSSMQEALFPANPLQPSRRVLLLHPFAFEAQCIAAEMVKRAIFLCLLDKMGVSTTDSRMVYGIAHGDQEIHRIVQADSFATAVNHIDQALSFLLEKKDRDKNQRKALEEAAQAVKVEPALGSVYAYLHALATRQRGLLEMILQETLDLATKGRIENAFRVARTLTSLDADPSRPKTISPQEHRFIHALRRCYVGYSLAELHGQLQYEKYMQAEEFLHQMHKSLPEATALTGEFQAVSSPDSAMVFDQREDRIDEELSQFQDAISARKIQNAYHVAIRKLSADPVETEGVRRVLDSLGEYKEHHALPLSESDELVAQNIRKLAEQVDQWKHDMPVQQLHRKVLNDFGTYLGHHKTYRLEEARYFLRGGENSLLSREDLMQAWTHLLQGYEKESHDHGLLSYLGFVLFLQGPKILHHVETFFLLWAKQLEHQLAVGRFRLHRLESPAGKKIEVPILSYPDAKKAHDSEQRWLEHVRGLAALAHGLSENANGEMLVEQYKKSVDLLRHMGRTDLAQLYEQHLGERWISLMVSRKQGGVKIPIPFVGDISLDLMVNLYRRFQRWRLFRRLYHEGIAAAMKTFLERMTDKITNP